jgi:hypothetical protein
MSRTDELHNVAILETAGRQYLAIRLPSTDDSWANSLPNPWEGSHAWKSDEKVKNNNNKINEMSAGC